jgi:hypothetical protein
LQVSEDRREKIGAIYLSPDAFARRTDDASMAEQMGDVFAAAGFPRPTPADDDRIHREAMQPEQGGPGFVQSAASGNSIGSGDAQRPRFASLRSPKLGRCRRLGMRHVRRRMCLPIIAIWLAFCVMSPRNSAGVIAANEFTAPPQSNSCCCGEYDAEIRAGRRAGLE